MYQRILVPVDGSSTSNRGLDEAARLAKLTQGRMRLIHVVDELSFALAMDAHSGFAGDWLKVLRENGARILDESRATVEAAGIEVETSLCDTFSGSVHEKVIAEAVKWGADLIVLGTHGRRGVGRLVLGSSAEHILRYAPVPVLLVRAPEEKVERPEKPRHISQPTGALAFE
ncbi:Putative universal stress protein [Variovorax sp. PBS-H4]|uniref:universal stress protein n=1 Tax=Variovorax sp. PBS-H4 TaxID=434008 RepID=UPI001317FADD|nr:universal stress protein [Variovorax sp. PBS-H4]VTU36363.1 Putative universal stress protein [Variovorax sp. PBS-H4]